MNRLPRIARALALGLVLALGSAGCGSGSTSADGHPGHGIVAGIDVAARTVTLDHDEIPGLMGAMTMTFQVAPGVPLDAALEGAEVDFRVEQEAGTYTVTALRRARR